MRDSIFELAICICIGNYTCDMRDVPISPNIHGGSQLVIGCGNGFP